MKTRVGRILLALVLCGALMLSCVGTVSATVADVAQKYAAGEVIKIACIGDSVTEGVGGTPYPAQLQSKLGRKFEVKNFGNSGTTARDDGHDNHINEGNLFGYRTANPEQGDWNYGNVYRTVITGGKGYTVYEQSKMYEADIYIIAIGGNDAKACNWQNGGENYKEHLRSLVEEYVNLPHHPMVIIGTSPGATKSSYNINLTALSETIVPAQRELAEEMGLMLVETFNPTNGKTDYFTNDGIHLNTVGYGVVAQQYAAAITDMVGTFSSTELTAFTVGETAGVIDNDTDSVYVSLPAESDPSALTAVATVGLLTQELPLAGLDLTLPQAIAVLSADGTAVREYTVYYTIGEKQATELKMESLPDKTVYDRGADAPDVTGGKVKVLFDDGSERVCDLAPTMLSGFETDIAGTKTVTVSLYGLTTTFEVTVREPVELKLTPPTKVSYLTGEALDMAGATMTVVYSDGSEEPKTDEAEITGYDPGTPGVQTVTVTLLGVSATFEVTVVEPKLLGDVDGNEKVNTTDARLTLQYAAGRIDGTALDTSVADVDGNEKVNTTDARLILQRAAGRIPAFPVEEK